jgi:hypothetical protein
VGGGGATGALDRAWGSGTWPAKAAGSRARGRAEEEGWR